MLPGLVGCALSGGAHPHPVPLGCHALRTARLVSGDSTTELLFPYYFELDSAAAPGGGGRVRLPKGDLNTMAGAWSWRAVGDSLRVEAASGDGAWRLAFRPAGAEWAGTLEAWQATMLARWEVTGSWVPCPAEWQRRREDTQRK